MDTRSLPFDAERMIYGGFGSLAKVQASCRRAEFVKPADNSRLTLDAAADRGISDVTDCAEKQEPLQSEADA